MHEPEGDLVDDPLAVGEPAAEEKHLFANFSTQVRGRIIGLSQRGMSDEAIRLKIGCDIRTVRLWKYKFQHFGDAALADHRKKNKGVRKTTVLEDSAIVDFVEERPFATIPEVLGATGVNVCRNTIRNRLKEQGITSHRAQKKTALTEAHREARLQFAREHIGWGAAQWAPIIFSDEKTFSSADDHRRAVYRPRGRQFSCDPRYVVEKQYSGRITCGFWRCMSAAGLMAIHQIPPRMNSETYVEILETVMLPCARARFPAEEYPVIYFMQDNAAIHTSARTMAWFNQHPEVQRMIWPAKSPDLNPIENVWSLMVKNWVSGQDRTREALINHVNVNWEELSERPEITQNLIDSMPNRMQCVVNNNGYWIDY